jgi:predicted MFS family arabinose efflux permease
VTLGVAVAPAIPVMIAWRVLQGLILPGVFTSCLAYINEEYSGLEVGRLMRVYVSGTVLGGFLGRLVTGETARFFGWRSGFFALSGMTLLGGLFIAKTLPPGTPKEKTARASIAGNLRALQSHALNVRLLPLCFIGFELLFCLVATFTYVTYYLASPPFLLSTQQLSWLFSVYLFGMFATPMSSLLLHRWNTRWTVIATLSMASVGVLITLTHHLPVVMLGLVLCSSGVFIGQAASLSHLRHVTDENKAASASGFYLAFYYLGGTVGGVLPGYFWRHGGWTATVLSIVAMQVAAAIVTLAALRPESKGAEKKVSFA